ncbi:uncharacterized protein LOC128244748 [Mya arenaria]|uniref:uncharacterized protein LOC128244748 n=1 Tax=Mya arenaria TaxID=6604 RepID=UPI0022E0D473|nr:uncharacterized protein LOC128243069 isoform X1 [Mya arenaria]XP_052818764.1 uncharacterized protein LOC128244748 [Mya arenaria]
MVWKAFVVVCLLQYLIPGVPAPGVTKICKHCDHVSNPADCTVQQACHHGQCGLDVFDKNGNFTYKFSCKDHHECENPLPAIGKRQHHHQDFGTKVCAQCCEATGCENNLCPAYAVATTVMPAVTTVAPDTSACHDTESDAFKCAELDKYDFCHDTTSVAYSIAHEKCPKHCGFCGGITTAEPMVTTTMANTPAPDTTVNPEGTTVINIVVTIGGGTDADCVDVEDDQFKCADWLSFGFCDPASGAGYQVSKLRCNKTCGICTP